MQLAIEEEGCPQSISLQKVAELCSFEECPGEGLRRGADKGQRHKQAPNQCLQAIHGEAEAYKLQGGGYHGACGVALSLGGLCCWTCK